MGLWFLSYVFLYPSVVRHLRKHMSISLGTSRFLGGAATLAPPNGQRTGDLIRLFSNPFGLEKGTKKGIGYRMVLLPAPVVIFIHTAWT